MFIPRFFIEKAVEGGYKLLPNNWSYLYELACDPFFWQSMGKALDWDNKKITIHVKLDAKDDLFRVGRMLGNGKRSPTVRFSRGAQTYSFQRKPRKDRWKRYSRDFFNTLMDGGDVERFWIELKKK